MDIQKATTLFNNAEQSRHFTKLIASLNLQSSTNITDFFNIITHNPLQWLNLLPKEAQSDDAFRKYKTPLYTLLNNTEVKQIVGETFCDNTRKLIQKGYKDNIEQVLKLRNNTMNIDINNELDEQETLCDDNSETDITSVLNIDDIEYQNQKTNDDYQNKIKNLEEKYKDALTEIKVLQTSLHHISQERDNYLKLLMK
jgi:hypothetical protein